MDIKYLVSVLLLIASMELTHRSADAAIPEWDYMVFAQQWPESVCIDQSISHQHKCGIFNNITDWTVHGLWPTRAGSMGPNFCNGSKPFNMDALQSILPELLEYWPNLYTDTPMGDFWNHEWTKHGSCAASLDQLNSEEKYFSKGLETRSQINLLKVLEDSKIVPRDKYTYQYDEVMKAFQKGLGVTPSIQCTYDSKTKTQYLLQVEICVDKTFKVIPCKLQYKLMQKRNEMKMMEENRSLSRTSPCRDTETIAYAKIHPQ